MALVSDAQQQTRPLVVAIDGPSGSGKSSTAKGVATRLGLAFLDTGAMYRAATWLALKSKVDISDRAVVGRLVREAVFGITLDPANASITINGTDVTSAIREPVVTAAVSGVATNHEVRAHLTALQQELITQAENGIVAEGRDITTVVAPDAQVRVLLVADPAARVARRHAELGDKADRADVTDQVIRRDRDDSTVAQFHAAAPGVTVIDSTYLTLQQVVDVICALTNARPRIEAGT
jgi:cytidylate kinase